MIRLATVFSGVGAIEHALQRLGINHKLIFACDNGGINLFDKKIEDSFGAIDQEFFYLEEHINNLSLEGFEDYIEVLVKSFNNLKEEYIEFKTKNVLENYEDIKVKTIFSLETLKNENSKEFQEYYNKFDLDYSDVLILVNEFKKYLSKNTSEVKHLYNYFDNITKDKVYRQIRREIKEFPKKLIELHSSIGSLEILEKLNLIEDYSEKKNFVDELYKNKEKSNFVKKSYFANYDIKDKDFHWNVSFLDGKAYKNQVDLFVGGSPCQSFSMVGKRRGFEDTRGTLFYEFVRLLKEIEPRFFIYENVQGVLSHDNGQTWEIMQNAFKDTGYNFKHYVFNARDFGIPQNRNRLFVIGFKNIEDFNEFKDPQKKNLEITMQNLLEDIIDSKYFLPEKGLKFVTDEGNLNKQYTQINGEIALCQKANQQFNWHGDFIECYTSEELQRLLKIDSKYFLSDKVKDYVLSEENSLIKPETDLKIARPLTATMHKMHRAGVDNYITYGAKLPVDKRKIRKLTPRECFRLMGFSDNFKITVSDTQAYQQAGNSIVVDVLISIVEELNKLI